MLAKIRVIDGSGFEQNVHQFLIHDRFTIHDLSIFKLPSPYVLPPVAKVGDKILRHASGGVIGLTDGL